MIHFSVLISWYIGPTLLHTCTDTHRRAQCPQVQTATMSIHKADRWSNRLSTAPCVCMCTVVGVYFLFIRLYFVSLPAVAQRCPALTGMGEIRAQISLWKKKEGGSRRLEKREERGGCFTVFIWCFFYPPLFQKLVLDCRECVRGRVMEKMERGGEGLTGRKIEKLSERKL